MKLYLVGMPGSGKTTLGRALAAHYALPFLDLDAEIEARAGQVIPAIFLEHGEARFRELETETLHDLVARPGALVLATGGGTPYFHDNMTLLNATGVTLWLDVPVPVLKTRLAAANEKNSRPLLASAGPTEKWLVETLSARQRFYGRAKLRCEGAACSVELITAQLAAAGFAPPAAAGLPAKA